MAARRRPLPVALIAIITFLTIVPACGGGGGGNSTNGRSSVRGHRNKGGGGQQSTNWAGYGLLGAAGGFNSVEGTWVVPSIVQSKKDTASSTWAGIGGGCTDPPTCATDDPTLIQAGTEQDNSSGKPTYFAWWEAIPAPSITAGNPLSSQTFDVQPGDTITVKIDGSDLLVWKIEIDNVRSGSPHWTFTTTVPYSAAGMTAEWIEESPLSAGTNGAGQMTLSDFHRVLFTDLTANGANPNLTLSDEIVLTDGSGNVLAQPSAPEGSNNSFAVCFGAGACN